MKKRKLRLKKSVKICFILVLISFALIGTSILYIFYSSPVDKTDITTQEITIESGMSTYSIAKMLKEKDLIKSTDFFLLYDKLNRCTSLKASSYDLSRSMSLSDIFDIMCSGDYTKNSINITFREGLRLTDYAKIVSENTNISEDDFLSVANDRMYLKELINKYWFLTDDILNNNIYYPLEGYLYPDTYNFRSQDVTSKEIIEKLLDEEDKVLSKYKSTIDLTRHSLHEYLTLASIAELEGTNSENRKLIIGVFENRLERGINLGSDVTTYYGVGKSMNEALTSDELNSVNSYNTRSRSMRGLPVGPICNPGKDSIDASINYTPSDYFYFVADKSKKIYFTKTENEHNALVAKLKKEGNWLW